MVLKKFSGGWYLKGRRVSHQNKQRKEFAQRNNLGRKFYAPLSFLSQERKEEKEKDTQTEREKGKERESERGANRLTEKDTKERSEKDI